MVKVAENDEDSSSLWAQGVLNRHLDVLKCDVGSTSSRRVAGFDRLGLNAFSTFDQDDSETVISLASNRETVSAAVRFPKYNTTLEKLTNLRKCHW